MYLLRKCFNLIQTENGKHLLNIPGNFSPPINLLNLIFSNRDSKCQQQKKKLLHNSEWNKNFIRRNFVSSIRDRKYFTKLKNLKHHQDN